jgi:hypothetical protein
MCAKQLLKRLGNAVRIYQGKQQHMKQGCRAQPPLPSSFFPKALALLFGLVDELVMVFEMWCEGNQRLTRRSPSSPPSRSFH